MDIIDHIYEEDIPYGVAVPLMYNGEILYHSISTSLIGHTYMIGIYPKMVYFTYKRKPYIMEYETIIPIYNKTLSYIRVGDTGTTLHLINCIVEDVTCEAFIVDDKTIII